MAGMIMMRMKCSPPPARSRTEPVQFFSSSKTFSFDLKREKVSISSLLNRVQKLRIYRGDFRREKSVHAKEQTLKYLTFKLLRSSLGQFRWRWRARMEKKKKKKKKL
jgi:hypothetical protein